MIARSSITFADLSQFLLNLGFQRSKQGKLWHFEHPPSQTTFLFRPYRANERVTCLDLEGTRRHLDLRGVLAQQEFDQLLTRATA